MILLLIFILIVLLANPQICLEGAVTGMNLWFHTIFPTLLPFIIISNMLLNVYSRQLKNPRLYVIFIGLSCGCPMAAIAASRLYARGMLERTEAQNLIGICNTLSPAFIISFCFTTILGYERIPLRLIAAVYAPVLILLLFYMRTPHKKNNVTVQPDSGKQELISLLDEAVMNGFSTITRLGGYIILFNILAGYADIFTKKYPVLNIVLTGMAEITTGMNVLGKSTLKPETKLLLTGGLLGFTGLCCIMQTIGILKEAGLSAKKYIYHKILLSVLTILSYYLAIYVL
jgi:sporulation integral membrane protein YlbJ